MTRWAQHRPTRTVHGLRAPSGDRDTALTWCGQALPVDELTRITQDTAGDPLCVGCLVAAPPPYTAAQLPHPHQTSARPAAPARPPGADAFPEDGRA